MPLDIYTRERIIILDYGDGSALIPVLIAGWSSPEAREAHNLKVAGSNPAPATPNHSLSVPTTLVGRIAMRTNCLVPLLHFQLLASSF
jgi:hypothetical protein